MMRTACTACFVLLCLATVATADRQLTSVTTNQQIQNVSILWDPQIGKGSMPIPLNDSRLQQYPGPEQIHITFVNQSAVVISWATGNASIVNQSMSVGTVNNPYGPYSTVNISSDGSKMYPVTYGTSASSLSSTAYGSLATYKQIYTGFVNDTGFSNNNPIANYSSPLLHHVVLNNLMANTTYFYKVSDGTMNSSTLNFTTPPPVGSYPLVMGVYADIGQTYNSSQTMTRLLQANPQILAIIGDWSYADDHLTTGQSLVIGFPNNTFTGNNISSPSGSYQPRWDSFFRLAQPLYSHIPQIPNSGNHELEPQGNGRYFLTSPWGLDNGRQFNSYLARVPISPLSSQSKGAPLYWSTEVGPVHYITLCNYENFLVGSAQFNWLANDLNSINRQRTPWVVATWHAPWYSSYTTHYKETESMRVSMEGLLEAAGVDLVLGGHLHEGERSHAIYNYQRSNCGVVHFTLGNGGNMEGLYTTFIDEPGTGNCPTPGPQALPNYQPGPWTPSFTYNQSNIYKGYCPTPEEGQPGWSAFRYPAFGHGILTFINDTVAHYQWNGDLNSPDTFIDDVYIIKNRTCYNFNGSPSAYAPFLSPQVANYVNTSAMEPINVPTDFSGTPSTIAASPTVSANSQAGGSYVAASG